MFREGGGATCACTHVWTWFSCASDRSCLRQSTLCSHLLSDAGSHWNAQYQGLQSRETTKLQHKDEGVGSSGCMNWRNHFIDQKKKKERKTKNGYWESRWRAVWVVCKVTKDFLSVRCYTVSFCVCVRVCKKRRRENEWEGHRQQKAEGWAGAEEKSELL